MNITHSFVSERDRALLSGDHSSYHAQATRRIHNLRRRLGASNRGRKYNPKAAVTPDNVAQNQEYLTLAPIQARPSGSSIANCENTDGFSFSLQVRSVLGRMLWP